MPQNLPLLWSALLWLAPCELTREEALRSLWHPLTEDSSADELGPAASIQLRSSPAHLEEMIRAVPRYVFAATTGHSGSRSLSDASNYVGNRIGNITFRFEELLGVTMQWRDWWDTRPSFRGQLLAVQQYYKSMVDQSLEFDSSQTYIDLGHHTLHGILHALPVVFGDRTLVVRLRRSRFPTAFSFAQYRRDLCENVFRICPKRHDTILHPQMLAPWTDETWSMLDFTQQVFWYVDEVEAQWYELLQVFPQMSYLECNWEEDLEPCFQALAAVLDVNVAGHGLQLNIGRHTQQNESAFGCLEELLDLDLRYQRFMAYPAWVQGMIAKAQF